MDFNLEELLGNLSPEEAVEIDWNAPEAGQFPPAVPPGVYKFVFKLRDDKPFDEITINKGQSNQTKHLSVIFDATVTARVTKDGTQVLPEPKTLTYQRVNAYKHEKMKISSADELARSLGLRYDNNSRARVEAFQGVSGRAVGEGEVAWRFTDRVTGTTYSTSPRTRKNTVKGIKEKDQPWPTNTDGTRVDTVPDSTGRKQYGQAEFIRFFSPAASADAASA